MRENDGGCETNYIRVNTYVNDIMNAPVQLIYAKNSQAKIC
jgi:hypothetical protein